MKRLLFIGLAVGTLALVPAMSASAMPMAHPSGPTSPEGDFIQVKGGKFKMKFKKPHHYKMKKWKHHHRRHW